MSGRPEWTSDTHSVGGAGGTRTTRKVCQVSPECRRRSLRLFSRVKSVLALRRSLLFSLATLAMPYAKARRSRRREKKNPEPFADAWMERKRYWLDTCIEPSLSPVDVHVLPSLACSRCLVTELKCCAMTTLPFDYLVLRSAIN